MQRWRLVAVASALLCSCGGDGDGAGGEQGGAVEAAGRCGPARAVVERVIDGDTVELQGGERVRYLLLDTPELHDVQSGRPQCFALAARDYNAALVTGREVTLLYDAICRDRYHRLLAYVVVGDVMVNALLVRQGYARVLWIPPNGGAYIDAFQKDEARARQAGLGLWGHCAQQDKSSF